MGRQCDFCGWAKEQCQCEGGPVRFSPTPSPIKLPTKADRIDQLTAERDELKAECERLREGLIKLRDCDFVITPADRMDAVRKIARDTLNKENTDD